jgi:putative peptidoglycan lipid II flippase
LLFERGAFDGADTAAMIPVLIIFSAGLPFYSYVTLVIRAFYSYKDTKTPVQVAAGSFLVNLALSLVLMRTHGTNGLALASNIAVVVQTIALQSILGHRHPELKVSAQFRGLAGALMLAIVMGAVVFGGMLVVDGLDLGSFATALISVCLLIPLGAAAYFGCGMLFRVDGLDEARGLVARFRSR